jgi:hypothetical protein
MATPKNEDYAVQQLRNNKPVSITGPYSPSVPDAARNANGYARTPIPDGMPEFLEERHDSLQWKYGSTNEAAKESLKAQKVPGIESIFFPRAKGK